MKGLVVQRPAVQLRVHQVGHPDFPVSDRLLAGAPQYLAQYPFDRAAPGVTVKAKRCRSRNARGPSPVARARGRRDDMFSRPCSGSGNGCRCSSLQPSAARSRGRFLTVIVDTPTAPASGCRARMRSHLGLQRHGNCNGHYDDCRQGDDAEEDNGTNGMRVELRNKSAARTDKCDAFQDTDCKPS
jgi:hypothetical protein